MQTTYSNAEIKQGIISGDTEVLKWCYVNIGSKIVGHIINNSGTKEEGDSFFRWALMKARENMIQKKYNDVSKIEAYIFSIGRNLWLDELRKKKNKRERETSLEEKQNWVMDNSTSPLEKIIKEEEITRLHQYIQLVDEKCQQVFKLHYFEEMTFEQMAKQENVTANTLRKRHFDCKHKLRHILQDNNFIT